MVESVGIFGRSGSGKTTLVRNIVLGRLVPNRVLALTVKNEYPEIKYKFFARNLTIDELNRFSRAASRLKGWTILIEDLYAFTAGYGRADALEQLAVVWSRERKLKIVYVSQRAIGTPRAWLTKTDVFFIGSGLPPQDLQYISDFIGISPDEVPKERFKFLMVIPNQNVKKVINDFTGKTLNRTSYKT